MKVNKIILLLVFLVANIFYSCSEKSTNPPDGSGDITNPPGGFINKLTTNSTGDFFAGTIKGLYISTDNGRNWRSLTNDINTSLDVEYILIPSNDAIFISYLSLFLTEVLRSTDNGATWTVSWTPLSLTNPQAYPVEKDNAGNIYICGPALYKSIDDGNSWYQFYPGNVLMVFVPSDTTIIIGVPGSFVGEILISNDSGTSWDSTHYQVNVSAFYKHDSLIFTGGSWSDEGGGGVHKSADGGRSWESSGLDQTSISSFFTNNQNKLFTGTSKGIYFTEDDGLTWQNVLSDSIITTLMKDENGFLYAGTNKGTFLRSTDNGMTWHN